MGPSALFDKSFLQSLSVDESVWFDHFFYPVICPLFYVETLADLSKARSAMQRSAEAEVRVVADKAPLLSGAPCAHHRDLCMSNLMGQQVPMNGRIPVAGGRPVTAPDGSLGVVFEESPEAQAFSRWQREEFGEVERLFAQDWRRSLKLPDAQANSELMHSLGVNPKSYRTERDVFDAAHAISTSVLRPIHQLQLLLKFLEVSGDVRSTIVRSWERNYPARPLGAFAPYAAHVLDVELFLRIALAAGIVSGERASNRIDIAYLCYLPFCKIFASSDKLHRRCVEPFLRSDQEFVWGPDLKQEFARQNVEFGRIPIAEREKGLLAFADHPLGNDSDLIVRLWNTHSNGWQKQLGTGLTLSAEGEKMLADRVNALNEAPTIVATHRPSDDDVAHLTIKRMVPKMKGSWWLLPKNVRAKT